MHGRRNNKMKMCAQALRRDDVFSIGRGTTNHLYHNNISQLYSVVWMDVVSRTQPAHATLVIGQ